MSDLRQAVAGACTPDLVSMDPLLGQADELPTQAAMPVSLGSQVSRATSGGLIKLLQRLGAQLFCELLQPGTHTTEDDNQQRSPKPCLVP